MTQTTGKYTDFEGLRERAVALRREGLSLRQIADELGVRSEAAEAVGPLSDRELFLTGVALYWAEGAKSKPYRRSEVLQFINSDPEVVGVDASVFSKPTIKKHNPRTVRKNTGENYHGCLVIYVRQSAELYRRMEGAWYGIVLGARPTA
ncbi:hypothetical protein CG723_27340 [Streptomyces sp. CB01635]|uniref:hypothetical protein n=1 Tax=unclassified Streptomyces TaxID=2593676 RepID=UPI000C27C087|nr:hypothetical protein [Streptomyces sp. CB01635]PJN08792.1 hypothetical protein CG723_27340 [Streptomyces sp. CB01635]